MNNTYIIYGENIYYLDENNQIFSVEYYTGDNIRSGFSKNEIIKPYLDGDVFIDIATPEELLEEKRKQAILIDLDYTQRISKLMSKHNDKFIDGVINGVPYNIPSDVIEEKERLKNECNQLILDLGITDFSYRQNNLQLKK